jgi:hypothetical protein
MVDRPREDLPRFVQIAARIEQVVDLGSVLGPLLDLVEVAMVRNQRIISLFGGRVHCGWIVLCRQATDIDFLTYIVCGIVPDFNRLKRTRRAR